MRFSLPVALLAALLLASVPGLASPRKPRVRFDGEWQRRPSARYAALSKSACTRELGARKIAFTSVEKAPSVLAPVRLGGSVGGVLFRTAAPASERATSPSEVYDCRLVLALHDWSKVLVAHGIDEVRVSSAWRPPSRSWPAGKLALRHPGALAVDVKSFGKKLAAGETVKRWLSVESDFHGRIGAAPCGARARGEKVGAATRELRAIVCEAADLRLFTSILTPDYDRAHHDHLHVEVRPKAQWFLLL